MGYGKAWKVPAHALKDLIANADKKGYCKIQVWHNSSDKTSECGIYLRLLLGWADMHSSAIRYYKPHKHDLTTKSNSTKPRSRKMVKGKAWKISESNIQKLLSNKDSGGMCTIEVWSDTSDKIEHCDLHFRLVEGWVDDFEEIPAEDPNLS